MQKTWLTIPAFLVLAAALPGMGGAEIREAEVTEYGIYEAVTTETIEGNRSPDGKANLVSRLTLREQTDRIPARQGTEFGIRYVLPGEPAGGSIPVSFVVLYPAPGVRDPETGRVHMRSELKLYKHLGQATYDGYHFDEEWELVPGNWVFQVWHEGDKLLEQVFTVYLP